MSHFTTIETHLMPYYQQQEAEQQEAVRQENERRNIKRREAEQQEIERRNIKRREAEQQEAEQRERNQTPPMPPRKLTEEEIRANKRRNEEYIKNEIIRNEERAKRKNKTHLIETLTRVGYQIQDNESDRLTVKKHGKVLGILDLEELKNKVIDSAFIKELKQQYALSTITHIAEKLGLELGEITEAEDGQIEIIVQQTNY
jgi:hypothetical protein